MTNKRLYEIIYRLGMIDDDGDKQASDTRTEAEIFEQDVASDLVNTMGFVDQLTTYNDLNTFGKLLVAIISELNKEKENKYGGIFKPVDPMQQYYYVHTDGVDLMKDFNFNLNDDFDLTETNKNIRIVSNAEEK